jgi:hypothetical protein
MGDENAGRDAAFGAGESGDNGRSGQETMGASYGIKAFSAIGAQRGEQLAPEPYLMPKVTYRNGGTERVADAIGLTPLGGLMPGPNAIAPAIPHGGVGAQPVWGGEARPFDSGIVDGYPEGVPVPYSVR